MKTTIRVTRILVPIDPGEPGRRSLGYAAELARRFGAEIVLMVANEALGVVPASEHARRIRDETLRAFAREGIAARVLAFPMRPPEDEADAILAAAAQESADLIVLETHGRHGLDRIVHLGSVSERVVRDAPCPVLVLRHATESEA